MGEENTENIRRKMISNKRVLSLESITYKFIPLCYPTPPSPIHLFAEKKNLKSAEKKMSQVLRNLSIVTRNGNMKYIQPWKILNQVKTSFHKAFSCSPFQYFFFDWIRRILIFASSSLLPSCETESSFSWLSTWQAFKSSPWEGKTRKFSSFIVVRDLKDSWMLEIKDDWIITMFVEL